jgi:hypothetical protein
MTDDEAAAAIARLRNVKWADLNPWDLMSHIVDGFAPVFREIQATTSALEARVATIERQLELLTKSGVRLSDRLKD